MAIRVGVHEDPTEGGRTAAEVKQRYPGAQIGRAFTGAPLTTVQDLRPKFNNVIQPYLDAGTEVIYVSVKTDIAQTRAGNWNARYQELGAHAESVQNQHGCEIIIIPWHEPEDNFSSPEAFVHYYNKVRLHVQTGGPNIKVKPCFMAYHWAPNWNGTASIEGKTDIPNMWFDGLIIDDGVTVDVYSGRSFPLEQTLPEHPGFARWKDALPAGTKWSVTERGWETPSSTNENVRYSLRTETMDREFDWLVADADDLEDYILWSSPGTEGAPGLVFDASAEDAIEDFITGLGFTPDPSSEQYQAGFSAGFNDGFTQGAAWYKQQLLDNLPPLP